MSLLYCHQYLENANVSTKFFNIFPHNLLQQQKHRERKHTVRRKRNDKRDWCKGKTWLWSVCTKRINMILTKWKEVDIKRGQIALCKDRCGRPWSSTRAYKVKRRGRRKKKDSLGTHIRWNSCTIFDCVALYSDVVHLPICVSEYKMLSGWDSLACLRLALSILQETVGRRRQKNDTDYSPT